MNTNLVRPLALASLLAMACGSTAPAPDAAADGTRNPLRPGDGPSTSELGAGSATAICAPEVAARCAPARHVGSTLEFQAAATELGWQRVSLGHTGMLTLSGDLVADVELSIDASTLAGPADCPTATTEAMPFPQCHSVLLREYAFPRWDGKGLVPGVSCAVVGDHPVRKGETCARLSIAKGTTFRLRAVVEDMHPSAPGDWPFVEIERGCAVPCDTGETRCDATQTCLGVGYEACAFCQGEAPEVCACREACSSKANGTECSFDTSPDTVVLGKCSAGTCSTGR